MSEISMLTLLNSTASGTQPRPITLILAHNSSEIMTDASKWSIIISSQSMKTGEDLRNPVLIEATGDDNWFLAWVYNDDPKKDIYVSSQIDSSGVTVGADAKDNGDLIEVIIDTKTCLGVVKTNESNGGFRMDNSASWDPSVGWPYGLTPVILKLKEMIKNT